MTTWLYAIVREVRCKGRGEWKSILTAHYSTALLQYKSAPAWHPVACQTYPQLNLNPILNSLTAISHRQLV